MKTIIALVLCAALAAALLTGCVTVSFSPLSGGGVTGRGSRETYSYSVGEITDIRVELYCNVEYYSAPSDTVTLEIQSNLRDYVKVEESGGVLTVRTSRRINWTGKAPVLTVSSPALSNVSIAGAGEFTAHDTIKTDSFRFRMDGAGTGNADLDVGSLSVNMAGAGSFRLSGNADSADFVIAGAGEIDALPLQTRDAMINLSGVGTVKLGCSGSLDISAGGVGTVEYIGSPSINMNRGGLVSVSKVG